VDGDGTRDTGDDDDWNPAARFDVFQGKAAEDHARLIAANLLSELKRALPSGVLEVRAVPWGVRWLVRVELCTRGSEFLMELLTGYYRRGPVSAGWPYERMEFGSDWGVDDDPALLAPGWYAVRPGIEYGPGYERALEAAAELGAELPPVMLAGPMDVDADTWEDGTGVVRVSLTLDDAGKLAALVGTAFDARADGGPRAL
jgi:hypothetical protein